MALRANYREDFKQFNTFSLVIYLIVNSEYRLVAADSLCASFQGCLGVFCRPHLGKEGGYRIDKDAT